MLRNATSPKGEVLYSFPKDAGCPLGGAGERSEPERSLQQEEPCQKPRSTTPGRTTGSGALIRRFLPYLAKYKKTLFLDLFCAALTTLCDIVLPKIMSTITNAAMGVGITLTAGIVLRLAALYFVLRIIDGAASYYMSSIGHIMGVHIETDMRRDAFDHLLKLDHTYYNNTKVGTIMGRITNDLFDVTEFAHHCPEEFFHCGHQDRGVLYYPVPGQCVADAGGVRLRAADGRGVRLPERTAAGAVPPAARADRRAELHHRGQPAGAGGS